MPRSRSLTALWDDLELDLAGRFLIIIVIVVINAVIDNNRLRRGSRRWSPYILAGSGPLMTAGADIETTAAGGIVVLARRRRRSRPFIIASVTSVETDIKILVIVITIVAHFGLFKGQRRLCRPLTSDM